MDARSPLPYLRAVEVGAQAMADGHVRLAEVDLGRAEEIGLRLVAEGRFETLSEACRAGLWRLEDDARVVDRLVALGEAGMASGIDEAFDIDAWIEEGRSAA